MREPQTRDAARYRELCAISDHYRRWLNMSSHRRRKLREKVRERDGGLCYYCQKRCFEPDLAHVQSLASGGTNELGNLRLAHHKCNLKERELG